MPSANSDTRVCKRTRTESSGEAGAEKVPLSPAETTESKGAHEESLCEVHDVPIPPDGGWGWVIVLASFTCNLIVDGIAYTFGVFLGDFVNYFGESKGTVSWVGSLLAGVYLTCGPLVSALTNKFGCRITCIIGSVVGCIAFILSTFSVNVPMLMVTYGVLGGIGFGLIYLPAIVSVGYYFEKKRAFATGIAVCGSGFGTFVFAPVATALLEAYGWKGANLILAGLILNCAVFGALMRPLTVSKKSKCKPLLQRMAEDKAMQLEKGSLMGSSYFMVQLPDGSYERRPKLPINADPGVHSSLNLDQLATTTASTLPTITEVKTQEGALSEASGSPPVNSNLGSPVEGDKKAKSNHEASEETEHLLSGEEGKKPVPAPRQNLDTSDRMNSSQPNLSTSGTLERKSRERKGSHGSAGLRNSRGNVNGDAHKRRSGHSQDEDVEMLPAPEKKEVVRPLARKDVFYSGSIQNLPEAQGSMASFRQSMISLSKNVSKRDAESGKQSSGCCTCLPESFRNSMSELMDFSLVKDPVFLFIGISNVFGMLGFYVPFVYIIDAAKIRGVEEQQAAFLLSIIGITNTIGRVFSGWLSDFPSVDSLFVTNVCIFVSGLSVACVPFGGGYIGMCIIVSVFGLFSSAFIALTSIVLVDLLGIHQLTNAFGLLCIFRGVAAIVGPPLAGSVYDSTLSYDVPFYLAGGFLVIAAAIGFMVPIVRRFTMKREANLAAIRAQNAKGEPSKNGSKVTATSTSPVSS